MQEMVNLLIMQLDMAAI